MTEELEVLCVNIKYHFPSSVHLGVRSKNYNKDALRFSYNYATLFSKVITWEFINLSSGPPLPKTFTRYCGSKLVLAFIADLTVMLVNDESELWTQAVYFSRWRANRILKTHFLGSTKRIKNGAKILQNTSDKVPSFLCSSHNITSSTSGL